jgi:hypothetical protein
MRKYSSISNAAATMIRPVKAHARRDHASSSANRSDGMAKV